MQLERNGFYAFRERTTSARFFNNVISFSLTNHGLDLFYATIDDDELKHQYEQLGYDDERLKEVIDELGRNTK